MAHALLPQMKTAHPIIELVLRDMAYSCQPLRALAWEPGLRLDACASPLVRSAGFVPQHLRWRFEQYFL